MRMGKLFQRIGATSYILWGVLHVVFGIMFLYGAMAADGAATLEDVAGITDLSASAAPFFAQHAFNLLWVGVFATVVGVWLNWKNDVAGFWVNASVVSLFDIGFIAFVLVPGHMSLQDGLLGPVLWVIALVFTGLAHFRRDADDAAGATPKSASA